MMVISKDYVSRPQTLPFDLEDFSAEEQITESFDNEWSKHGKLGRGKDDTAQEYFKFVVSISDTMMDMTSASGAIIKSLSCSW